MTPAVTAIVRVGTWTIIGAFAVLGLLTTGAAIVVPAAVAAAVGAVVGWSLGKRSAWVALSLAAAGGAGVLAIAGLALLAGSATFVAAPALVVPLVLTHRARRPAQQVAVEDLSVLGNLTNAQLAREWHSSYIALAMARDPRSLEMICGLRRRQLDEIERRAPGGFQRWIESGTWVRGDSAPFLGG